MPADVVHAGGCHCGRIRFEVTAPADLDVWDCNCSICSRFAFVHLIVPAERFALLRGREQLSLYRFNTGVAKHYFCSQCGVKSFYIPRSHPDGVSVNARCIDAGSIASLTVNPFNGKEWEDARALMAVAPPPGAGIPQGRRT
jgi:hypothetical protein